MLKLDNITKKYHGRTVLNNVSLSVDNGQIAVLLGASGVGKSTLLRILNNLETFDAGSVFLNGKLLDLSQSSKEHTIGIVFQNFNLFEHLTVEQNITLALEKVAHKSRQEARTIAQQLLTRFGLQDKARCYIAELSGGQKQRLAIARTLALKPNIICFDEPTSALDPLLTQYVAKNIQQLAQEGYIVLVATHDISLLDKLNCTIYLMEGGKIIESAPSAAFKLEKNKFPSIARFVAGVE